ncbi:hypothetical protein ACN23B_11860 [Anabaena sp. FACHB-709]|nr:MULTISPECIES: hypothetical protein [Nostocaceae]
MLFWQSPPVGRNAIATSAYVLRGSGLNQFIYASYQKLKKQPSGRKK